MGGQLYVFDPSTGFTDGWSQALDLTNMAGFAGCDGAKTPHMVRPTHGDVSTHVAVSYTAGGAVHIIETKSMTIVACLDIVKNFDGSAGTHDIIWSHDNANLIVIHMGGKLHHFSVDLATNSFDYATVFHCKRIQQALGYDTTNPKPIAGVTTASNLMYISFAHGGVALFQLYDTHMSLLHVYSSVLLEGRGGLWGLELPGDRVAMAFGVQTDTVSDYQYIFDVAAANRGEYLEPVAIATPGRDLHGMAVCTSSTGQDYLVSTNRVSNTIDFTDLSSYQVVQSLDMTDSSAAPDYMSFDPQSRVLYAAARGPDPLTALKNKNEDRIPGMIIASLGEDCLSYSLLNELPTLNDFVMMPSDPHGLERVFVEREDCDGVKIIHQQVWMIDQAPSRVRSIWDMIAVEDPTNCDPLGYWSPNGKKCVPFREAGQYCNKIQQCGPGLLCGQERRCVVQCAGPHDDA